MPWNKFCFIGSDQTDKKYINPGFSFSFCFQSLDRWRELKQHTFSCWGSKEKLILVFLLNREQEQQWLHDITFSVSVLKESGPLNSQSDVGTKGLGRTSREHWHSFRDLSDKSNSAIKQLLWEPREIHAFIMKTGNVSTSMF